MKGERINYIVSGGNLEFCNLTFLLYQVNFDLVLE